MVANFLAGQIIRSLMSPLSEFTVRIALNEAVRSETAMTLTNIQSVAMMRPPVRPPFVVRSADEEMLTSTRATPPNP